MDPTTVLLVLVSGAGAALTGLGAVVGSGVRAARRREATALARRLAVSGARWEVGSELVGEGKERVRLVKIAELGGKRWTVEEADTYVDVPVGDIVGLLDAQTNADLEARRRNGELW